MTNGLLGSARKAVLKNCFFLPCTIKFSDQMGSNTKKQIQEWPVIFLLFSTAGKQSEILNHEATALIQSVHITALNTSFCSTSTEFHKNVIVHKKFRGWQWPISWRYFRVIAKEPQISPYFDLVLFPPLRHCIKKSSWWPLLEVANSISE